MRLAVTSDLHFDFQGRFTRPELIEELVLQLVEVKPDAIVLAGDIAAGFAAFEACLAEFKGLGMPVGVLAGNHDVWRDNTLALSTEALWGGALEEAAERQDLVWLESKSIRVATSPWSGRCAGTTTRPSIRRSR
jgi:3',5'-cyclic AMP phosphodiesterase CpdA